jgi:hypothetical protein
MSQPIAVNCTFEPDGRIQLHRIKLADHWLNVQQGRQWTDEQGHHILVIIAGQEVQEILLSPTTLHWQIMPGRSKPPIVC